MILGHFVKMVTPSVVKSKREENNIVETKCTMKGVKHLHDNGVTKVPSKYILPLPDRPEAMVQGNDVVTVTQHSLKLPVVDLHLLQTNDKAQVLESLDRACKEYGFFQVVNHGISCEAINRIKVVSKRFFELPFEERMKYMSSDLSRPVRYGTSFNQMNDGVLYWRDFLKLNCQPLESMLPFWPNSPMEFRDDAVAYSTQTRRLFSVIMEVIFEALGVNTNNNVLHELKNNGSHLMIFNCFPPCPQPELTLGMPPHSDYGFLTLLLPDDVKGLQVQLQGDWITVDPLPNSIVVNVGDHLEIFSNGRYKSVLHRVVVNALKSRMSVASLHSVAVESVVRPSPELVDDDNPIQYMDTDFAAFLDYISSQESRSKNFLESRKLTLTSDKELSISKSQPT